MVQFMVYGSVYGLWFSLWFLIQFMVHFFVYGPVYGSVYGCGFVLWLRSYFRGHFIVADSFSDSAFIFNMELRILKIYCDFSLRYYGFFILASIRNCKPLHWCLVAFSQNCVSNSTASTRQGKSWPLAIRRIINWFMIHKTGEFLAVCNQSNHKLVYDSKIGKFLAARNPLNHKLVYHSNSSSVDL